MPCDLRQIKIFNNTKQDMKYIYIYISFDITVEIFYQFTNPRNFRKRNQQFADMGNLLT